MTLRERFAARRADPDPDETPVPDKPDWRDRLYDAEEALINARRAEDWGKRLTLLHSAEEQVTLALAEVKQRARETREAQARWEAKR